MKTTISCFIFLFFVAGVNAQEIKITNNNCNKIAIGKDTESSEALTLTKESLENDICYGEISKVTFYEALIRQNNFDIDLENSDFVLRSTEEIIAKSQERISYSE